MINLAASYRFLLQLLHAKTLVHPLIKATLWLDMDGWQWVSQGSVEVGTTMSSFSVSPLPPKHNYGSSSLAPLEEISTQNGPPKIN